MKTIESNDSWKKALRFYKKAPMFPPPSQKPPLKIEIMSQAPLLFF